MVGQIGEIKASAGDAYRKTEKEVLALPRQLSSGNIQFRDAASFEQSFVYPETLEWAYNLCQPTILGLQRLLVGETQQTFESVVQIRQL